MRWKHLPLISTIAASVAFSLTPLDAGESVVFEGPGTTNSLWLSESRPSKDQPLRVVTVEERVGVARQRELVRVPLFFHAGECSDVKTLAVFAFDDRQHQRPLVVQADDIRFTAAGDVGRAHLYFATDLAAWEAKKFHVVVLDSPTSANPADAEATGLEESPDRVTLAGEDLQVSFGERESGPGAIAFYLAFRTLAQGGVSLPHSGYASRGRS